MIDQLIDIISKEASLFESFLELLERQKQMLVSNDIEGLKELTALQHERIAESRALSRIREQVIERIKNNHSWDGDVTVTRILALADEDQSVRLTQLRDLMLGLNHKINTTRNTNAMLLNQSREFVARTMAMLAKMHTPETAYSKRESADKGSRAIVLDRRA
jgi:hypothetical protein